MHRNLVKSRILCVVEMAEEHLKSDDDIEAILHLAVQQNTTSEQDLRARLLSAADELGLTPSQIEAAEIAYREERARKAVQVQTEVEDSELWKQFRKTQVSDFISHLGTYAAVNAFLVWLDLGQGNGLNWAYWPIAGWGIAIAIQAFSLIASQSSDNLDEFQKWKKKYKKKVKKPSAED